MRCPGLDLERRELYRQQIRTIGLIQMARDNNDKDRENRLTRELAVIEASLKQLRRMRKAGTA